MSLYAIQCKLASESEIWQVESEKLGQLRQDWAIATDTAREFELEQQLQTEEEHLAQLSGLKFY